MVFSCKDGHTVAGPTEGRGEVSFGLSAVEPFRLWQQEAEARELASGSDHYGPESVAICSQEDGGTSVLQPLRVVHSKQDWARPRAAGPLTEVKQVEVER